MPVAAPAVLHQIESQIRQSAPRRPELDEASSSTARKIARVFAACLDQLNLAGAISADQARNVESSVLTRSSGALAGLLRGDPAAAARALVREWAETTAPLGLGGFAEELRAELVRELPSASVDPRLAELDWLVVYGLAVVEHLSSSLGQGRPRRALGLLMSFLELSDEEVGSAVGVSGNTVRDWLAERAPIPADRRAAILSADEALARLLEMFRVDRLPAVVRREAELFDGQRALDWIVQGRMVEVVERYEAALLYQA